MDRDYLDASGFAPPLPTSATGAREGACVGVPSEAPQGRRGNVVGARAPCGPAPRRVTESRTGKLARAAFLRFLGQDVAGLPTSPDLLPAGSVRARPGGVVRDNAAVHRSTLVQAVPPALAAAGVRFDYLPPDSPELNAIAPLWRPVPYDDLPVRS